MLKLEYPVPVNERIKLVKELREIVQSVALETSQYQIEKALSPIKKEMLQISTFQESITDVIMSKIEKMISIQS